MFSQDATVWVLLIACITMMVWNTIVVQYNNPGATISETVLYVAQRWPVIPLMVGVLIGHVFWPQYKGPLPPIQGP